MKKGNAPDLNGRIGHGIDDDDKHMLIINDVTEILGIEKFKVSE